MSLPTKYEFSFSGAVRFEGGKFLAGTESTL